MSSEIRKYATLGAYLVAAGLVLGPGADALEMSVGLRQTLTFGAALAPMVWMIREHIDRNNIPTLYDRPDPTKPIPESRVTRLVQRYRELGRGLTRPSSSIIRAATSPFQRQVSLPDNRSDRAE